MRFTSSLASPIFAVRSWGLRRSGRLIRPRLHAKRPKNSVANWKSWGDVPVGEQNTMDNLINIWQQTVGFKITFNAKDLLAFANAGLTSQHDIGQFMEKYHGGKFDKILNSMPWAKYGLDKDSYAAMANTFETTYKKITGATISE